MSSASGKTIWAALLGVFGIIGAAIAAWWRAPGTEPGPITPPPTPPPPSPEQPGVPHGSDLYCPPGGTRREFLAKISKFISFWQSKFPGFDLAGVLAVAAWETGWFTAPGFLTRHNNCFGISHSERDPEGNQLPYDFPDIGACCDYLLRMLSWSQYQTAYDNRAHGANFIDGLRQGGYNGLSWENGVLDCFNWIRVNWEMA